MYAYWITLAYFLRDILTVHAYPIKLAYFYGIFLQCTHWDYSAWFSTRYSNSAHIPDYSAWVSMRYSDSARILDYSAWFSSGFSNSLHVLGFSLCFITEFSNSAHATHIGLRWLVFYTIFLQCTHSGFLQDFLTVRTYSGWFSMKLPNSARIPDNAGWFCFFSQQFLPDRP